MADLISASEPVKRAVELEALGVDYVNVHIGIDQQMIGKNPISILREISEKVSVQLAVAGGLEKIQKPDHSRHRFGQCHSSACAHGVIHS